ncbi:hypothetical protein HYV69_01615 [Candidatus Uhrbacteria bacterium]|nr:hypothetical protein [Candidatus Uhrbacteria bacterium]
MPTDSSPLFTPTWHKPLFLVFLLTKDQESGNLVTVVLQSRIKEGEKETMSERVMDSADLGFLVKMVKDGVLKPTDMGKEHVFKAFCTDLTAKPSIIVCCSEYVSQEKFAEGSIVIAVLGGAVRLADGNMMSVHSDTAPSFLRRQIKEATKSWPHLHVVLIVDAPCSALDTEGPLDVVQQIRDMISGLEVSDLDTKTEVSCFLRINTSAGGTYYRIEQGLWTLWYSNYEVDVLGHEDDPDPGAAVAGDDCVTDETPPPDDNIDFDHDDVMEACRESQYDTTDDTSHDIPRRNG